MIHKKQLFDSAEFERASVMSKSGIDLDRLCENDTINLNMINEVIVKSDYTNGTIIGGDTSSSNSVPNEDIPVEEIFSLYPYDVHFLPTIRSLATEFMKDPLLPDKLVTLRNHHCIILQGPFMSLNWASIPNEFEEVHRELVPNPFN